MNTIYSNSNITSITTSTRSSLYTYLEALLHDCKTNYPEYSDKELESIIRALLDSVIEKLFTASN